MRWNFWEVKSDFTCAGSSAPLRHKIPKQKKSSDCYLKTFDLKKVTGAGQMILT